MTEEAPKGAIRRREEAEAWLGVEKEALERAAKEYEQREFEEALRRVEERERSEVQQLAEELRTEALKRMEYARLEADIQQEAELKWPKVKTTGEREGSRICGSEEVEEWENGDKEI